MSKHPFRSRNRQEELMRVAEQAAEWLVALEDESESENEEFAQWLLESPLHTQMFLRAAAIDRKGASLHPIVLRRLMDRLEMDSDKNVLPLREGMDRRMLTEGRGVHSRRWWPLGLAAGFVLAIAALWIVSSGIGQWQRYVTDIGEQRSITLQDGSIIHINTHSRVDVHYSPQARDIRLVNGEALFTVHHDASRPFRVHIDDAVVRAVGTQFNVYRRANATMVSVIEGIVQISKERAAPVPLILESRTPRRVGIEPQNTLQELAAGQAATVKPGGEIKERETVDVAQVTAWRQGELVFERASLEDIVTEFNRYNRKPQLRVDESIADKHRYTAVFNTNEPQTLLKFLSKDGDLEIRTQGDELIIRPRAGSSPPPN